jgi:hypothetical protein
MKPRNPHDKVRPGRGIGARLNARTHGLFTRIGSSTAPSSRVQQLRDAFALDAITADIPGRVEELADVQAHMEDIRRVQQSLRQEILESAGLDRDCESGLGPSSDGGADNTDCNEAVLDADPVCLSGDDQLDRLTRKLLSLAGYQKRAAGRRRRLVLDILRERAQRQAPS